MCGTKIEHYIELSIDFTMDNPKDYINNSIVKCRARRIIYHNSAVKWGRIHWGIGIANALISAAIAIATFFAKMYEWSSVEMTVVGGLVLTVSNAVITAVKAGYHQQQNEAAGDSYANLEDKITAMVTTMGKKDVGKVQEYCIRKLADYTKKFDEPPVDECLQLEKKINKEMFSV